MKNAIGMDISCEDYDFSALAAAFSGEYVADCPISLEIVITDKEDIRKLNSRFRRVDSATDVLSFPTLDGIRGKKISKGDFPYDLDEEGKLFIGSVVICKEVAASQAEEYGHSFERELFYLATHGVCHLLGYDHMTDEDKAQMREKEETVLKKIGLERE